MEQKHISKLDQNLLTHEFQVLYQDLSVLELIQDYSLEEVEQQLNKIEKEPKYSVWMTTLFGGIGAAGFALFFDGGMLEAVISFAIGILIRLLVSLLSMMKMNDFINNVIASMLLAILSIFSKKVFLVIDVNVVVISGIMLLIQDWHLPMPFVIPLQEIIYPVSLV